MTTHRYHPDPARGDPPDALLWDDCPRCAEQAKDPRALDRSKLMRIVAVCKAGQWAHHPTRAEAQAERVVYRALCLVETITGLSFSTLTGTRPSTITAESDDADA